MINQSINNGGIYRAFIINVDGDIRIYIPGLYSNFNECPINKDGSLNVDIYQKNKEAYPIPLWCIPNAEAKKCDEVHPCWVVFENGDNNRPIIVGFLGKGIKYNAKIVVTVSTTTKTPETTETTKTPETTETTKTPPSDDKPLTTTGWSWPISTNSINYNRITSGYKVPRNNALGYHSGIDIGVPKNTPILAAASGTVVGSSYGKSEGYYVKLSHDTNGDGKADTWSLYYHMISQSSLSVGQTVNKGDIVGYCGTTGHSTGYHLHFEIRTKNGKYGDDVSPYNYVSLPK